MQTLILSNQHSERKQVVILGNHLFFIEYQNVTAFHFKSGLELGILLQFAPCPEFLTGENIELICNAYLKNCNEYPDESYRSFSDDEINVDRLIIAHATKNCCVMRKLILLKDLKVIKILMGRSDIDESFKDELLLLLINIKPDADIIKYIAQNSRSAAVIDKLLYYVLVNKNWPSDIYAKIHYCFVKAYNLFDYPVYETEIKELYTSFLSSDSLPNCLIEHILLTNTRFCGNDEKIQRILSHRNLPQYIMEYSLASLLGFELIGNIPYLCIRKHQAN